MKRFSAKYLAVSALLLVGVLTSAGPASAAMSPAPGLAQTLPIEAAQYVYGGRRYCWYANGWRGPGWYRCGFAWRQGLGWGGPGGWLGWSYPGPRVYVAPQPHYWAPPPRRRAYRPHYHRHR